jgi:hypothetical protein
MVSTELGQDQHYGLSVVTCHQQVYIAIYTDIHDFQSWIWVESRTNVDNSKRIEAIAKILKLRCSYESSITFKL